MDCILIYLTCGSEEEARKLARTLVEEKLAACVNYFPIASVYRWRGGVEEAKEWAMICKTTAEKFERLRSFVREKHSYELPCIIKLGVEGDRDFLRWIRSSVS